MHALRRSIAATALVAAGIAAPAAQADVKPGRTIENFHGINFVAIDGYPGGEDVRIEVLRRGVVIGHATKRTDADGLIELNHTGDGDCFTTPTPDILPGDVIRTTLVDDPADTDFSVVRDVRREEPVVEYVGDDPLTPETEGEPVIRVAGHAREPGTTTALDNVEIRLNRAGGRWRVSDRKDWRVNPEIGLDGSFVAEFRGASPADIAAVASAEVAAEWIDGDAETPSDITVDDGTGDGPCGPATRTAITQVTPAVVNAAWIADPAHAGRVTISGLAAPVGVDAVRVGIVDADGAPVGTVEEVVPTDGVWSAAIDVSDRPDGAVHVRVEYVGETAPIAQTTTIRKDATAPELVRADLAEGTYASAQAVHLSSPDADVALRDIRYTTDGTEPTAASQRYTGAVSVTADRTIKAIAIDAAGNPGPVATFAYVIQPPKPVVLDPVVIEKPVDVIVEKPVEVVVEKQVEVIREVAVPQPVAAPVVAKPVVAKPVAPLRLGAVSHRAAYKLAAARKGIAMRVARVGTGLTAVLNRGGKVTVVRSGGSYAVKLKVARKGTYRLTLTPQGGAAVSKTITFKVV